MNIISDTTYHYCNVIFNLSYVTWLLPRAGDSLGAQPAQLPEPMATTSGRIRHMNNMRYGWKKKKKKTSLETTFIYVKKHGEFNGATPRALRGLLLWTAPKKPQKTAIFGYFWGGSPTSWRSRVMKFDMVKPWPSIMLQRKNEPNRIILRYPKMAPNWPKK